MIRSFAHKGLRRFFEQGSHAGVQPAHVKRLRTILGRLHTAIALQDLALPGLRLHALHGDLEGRRAVSVNGPWRVTFRFEEGHGWEVDYVQYH
ncbi:MAG: type II toxin-antitoxin system RelE/ParE family toxin [Candidatus Lambdaproteobacteria bacterium]|nr:type II toxin-antitoxin system RelE/ParE family toxin [Candidatus Lambdaproteobacteria bacterium]